MVWCLVWLFALLGGSSGCDADPSPSVRVEQLAERGRLEATIGSLEPIRFDLAGADCREETYRGAPALFVRAYGTKRFHLDDTTLHPHLFSAVLPAELGSAAFEFGAERGPPRWEAIASLLDVDVRGEHYEMIQLIAKRVDGTARSFRCEASRPGDRLQVDCRDVRPLPWFAPGEIPGASFEVRVPCREKLESTASPR